MSSIGWIDFSSEHRDKVRTVIDLLSAPGVIDELGIGVIRDAFADRMFPGISTIQTRPKYFTLTALLLKEYLEVEMRKRTPRSLERFLDEEEKDCRIRLVQRHGAGRLNLGIIGGTFGLRKDRDVVRKPSSVYWNGLLRFGFVSPRHLSLPEFGRRLASGRAQLRALLEEGVEDEDNTIDRSQRVRVVAPEVPKDYRENLSINLTRAEADFLRAQITACQPDSLIGQILMDDAAIDEILQLEESARFEDFAELPLLTRLKNEDLRCTVRHAQKFWRLMEGAHIRYNCLLQGMAGIPDLQTEFEKRWRVWRSRVRPYLEGWDTAFMWQTVSHSGSQVKGATRDFISGWLEECRSGASNLERCNALVKRQEIHNKGKRARLFRGAGKVAINEWVGLVRADYRFPQVRQLIRDIRDAERGGGGEHA